MKIYLYKMIGGKLHIGEVEVEEKPKIFKIINVKSIKNECGTWTINLRKTELNKMNNPFGYSYSMFVLDDTPEQRRDFIDECIKIEKKKLTGFERKIEQSVKMIEIMMGEYE